MKVAPRSSPRRRKRRWSRGRGPSAWEVRANPCTVDLDVADRREQSLFENAITGLDNVFSFHRAPGFFFRLLLRHSRSRGLVTVFSRGNVVTYGAGARQPEDDGNKRHPGQEDDDHAKELSVYARQALTPL